MGRGTTRYDAADGTGLTSTIHRMTDEPDTSQRYDDASNHMMTFKPSSAPRLEGHAPVSDKGVSRNLPTVAASAAPPWRWPPKTFQDRATRRPLRPVRI